MELKSNEIPFEILKQEILLQRYFFFFFLNYVLFFIKNVNLKIKKK